MVENNSNELESTLKRYAFNHLKEFKMVLVLMKLMPGKKRSEIKIPEQFNTTFKQTVYYFRKIIQAFIDVIENTHRDIHINQIACINFTETNYLLNVRS